MIYNTAKCQEIFCNRYIGEDISKPFKDYKNGKAINETAVFSEDLRNYKVSKKQDMKSFYYKALLCYSEGIQAVIRKNYTWATIKLYYSVYFCLRCSLLCRNIVIVRAMKNLYYIKLQENEKYKKPNDSTDHGGTINVYTSLFKSTDFLCSNFIEDNNAYLWLKRCREIVNYIDEVFHDPEITDLWKYIVDDIKNDGIEKTISNYIEYKSQCCFSPETAVLAIPTYRIIETAQEIKNEGVVPLNKSQKEWVINMLKVLPKDIIDKIVF